MCGRPEQALSHAEAFVRGDGRRVGGEHHEHGAAVLVGEGVHDEAAHGPRKTASAGGGAGGGAGGFVHLKRLWPTSCDCARNVLLSSVEGVQVVALDVDGAGVQMEACR